MTHQLTVGMILRRIGGLLAVYPAPAAIVMILFVSAGTLFDTYPSQTLAVLNTVINMALIVAEYVAIEAILIREGLLSTESRRGRGVAYFLVSLVTGLGMVIGFALLVLPGLYLYARWCIAVPLAIAQNMSVSEAVGESSDLTREHIGPIMIALAIVSLPTVGGLALFFAYPATDYPSIPLAILANGLTIGGSVLAWYAATALFALLRRPDPTLEEVFA